ncbi:hypothetical protein K439DRAFT_956966 [Ramaria rubella]|nr:hypothetical protein K439DRAFT_956966 [Ramaria rubella]
MISMGQIFAGTDGQITQVFSSLSNEIEKIDSQEKRTVLDLIHAVDKAMDELDRLISVQRSNLTIFPEHVRGGYGGRGISVYVSGGKPGTQGQGSQIFPNTWSPKDFVQAQIPFAHPVQCAMLLEKANIFFYINSSKLKDHATRLYQRLIDRLSFLPLKPTDPLYKAYQESLIMPRTSLDDLKRIAEMASAQLLTLQSGLNYNGHAPQWVPRGNYTFFKKSLDDSLADLTLFENAYTAYQAALLEQDKLNDAVKLTYDKTSQTVNSLTADIKDLEMMLENLNNGIIRKKPEVEEAKQALIKAYNAETRVINNAFGLSVPQLVNAFTLIAFSPGKLMLPLQAGNLIYQGFTSVPTIDGLSVTKEYLASQFKKSEATLKDVSTALKTKINGKYPLDDAFVTRLIVEKEQMLAQLDSFSTETFGGVNDAREREDLKNKFNTFIDVVTKRNELILQYNVTVKLILTKTNEITKYKNKRTELVSKQIKENDPDLPTITEYISSVYQTSRSRTSMIIFQDPAWIE